MHIPRWQLIIHMSSTYSCSYAQEYTSRATRSNKPDRIRPKKPNLINAWAALGLKLLTRHKKTGRVQAELFDPKPDPTRILYTKNQVWPNPNPTRPDTSGQIIQPGLARSGSKKKVPFFLPDPINDQVYSRVRTPIELMGALTSSTCCCTDLPPDWALPPINARYCIRLLVLSVLPAPLSPLTNMAWLLP